MGKLRVGFIGVGDITDLHYPGYKDNPKAELYAICDVDEERLQKRASEWKVEKTYTDYRELLTDPNIEAVEVITPHHLHAEMGIAALKAGKHISMQKPMAVNIGECDELIKTAERSKKLFRVFENFRFYPPMVKAKELEFRVAEFKLKKKWKKFVKATQPSSRFISVLKDWVDEEF